MNFAFCDLSDISVLLSCPVYCFTSMVLLFHSAWLIYMKHKIWGTDLKIYGFSGMFNNGLITERWCWMSKERKHEQCNHLQMQIYLEWKNSLHTSLQILQSCCRDLVWYMREKLTLPSGDQICFSQQSHQWKEQQNACNANIKYICSHWNTGSIEVSYLNIQTWMCELHSDKVNFEILIFVSRQSHR